MGDASDPYVVAQVGEMVQQTPSVSNELNPVWKELGGGLWGEKAPPQDYSIEGY
ncbi:Chaperone protein ClpC1 [Durusdinium trenchii]|uniref:Chloroplastic n=1 Tax=Durusdinium trenchii TaxID=1381693 RepID=A0ABP0MZQ8_9DINO